MYRNARYFIPLKYLLAHFLSNIIWGRKLFVNDFCFLKTTDDACNLREIVLSGT